MPRPKGSLNKPKDNITPIDTEIINPVIKNLGGRPVKYDSVDKLEIAIDNYFSDCEVNNKAPTWASMLLFLNVSDQTILNYRNNEDNNYPGYLDVIKKAERMHCNFWQQYAIDHPNLQSFCMFELKQPHNGGFTDRPANDTKDVNINVKIGDSDSKLLD